MKNKLYLCPNKDLLIMACFKLSVYNGVNPILHLFSIFKFLEPQMVTETQNDFKFPLIYLLAYIKHYVVAILFLIMFFFCYLALKLN